MRLFIGFKIPATKQILEKLKILQRLTYVKAVEKENLHVCLKFLGDVDEKKLPEIEKIISLLKGKFLVGLKSISAFPSNDYARVVKINVISEKMNSLQAELEKILKKLGFEKEEKDFVGHLTLARVKGKPDDTLKRIFDTNDYGEYEIDKIELIESVLTPNGPIYKTIYAKKL